MASPAVKRHVHSALVDELGALEKEIAPFRLKLARADALRAQLREIVSTKPAGAVQTIEGKGFVVELGPRAIVRTVNVVKLESLVSLRCLVGIVSCSLKALLENNVSSKVQAAVIESHATGSRSITITERGSAA